jgi:hypothetical protein
VVWCLEILIASCDHAPVECDCVWPGITVRCKFCAYVKTTKIAFLVARRAISSITDKAGLKRYAAEVGPVSDEDLEELEVRLKWGKIKEPFAIRAIDAEPITQHARTAPILPEHLCYRDWVHLMCQRVRSGAGLYNRVRLAKIAINRARFSFCQIRKIAQSRGTI